MSKGSLIGLGCLGVLVLVALLVGIAGIGQYNSLVGTSQAVDAQWSQVENVYQRRADLIPNLVAAVKGAAEFERGTLEAVTEARASVGRMQVDPRNLPNDPAAFQRFEHAGWREQGVRQGASVRGGAELPGVVGPVRGAGNQGAGLVVERLEPRLVEV